MVHFLQDILKKASQRRLRRRTLTVLPLCRAGEARPYADGATESAGQKFRCAGRATPAPWLSLWESWHGVSRD